ncbi:hypothetical protein RRG08_052712 [Elysia crispata]|uniref:Uncharacterized protein n=1 Tax=Elysia crispata TaxID=231223 RepID=A0AAE1EB47_9GAST|nr:hypothetical protein RRG08_052712 [Elysia crispata]
MSKYHSPGDPYHSSHLCEPDLSVAGSGLHLQYGWLILGTADPSSQQDHPRRSKTSHTNIVAGTKSSRNSLENLVRSFYEIWTMLFELFSPTKKALAARPAATVTVCNRKGQWQASLTHPLILVRTVHQSKDQENQTRSWLTENDCLFHLLSRAPTKQNDDGDDIHPGFSRSYHPLIFNSNPNSVRITGFRLVLGRQRCTDSYSHKSLLIESAYRTTG